MARLLNLFPPEGPNRVAEAIMLFAEQDAKLKINNPVLASQDTRDLILMLNQYRSIETEFRRTKNHLERMALKFVRYEIKKLKAKIEPTWFNKIYYSEFAEKVKAAIRGENNPITYYQKTCSNIVKELTQQHNLQNLTAELKKSGFNLEMEGSLKRMISLNLPEFHLRYADIENPNAHYVLHFKKIPDTDLYYFQKFDAVARPSLDALLNRDPSCCKKTFHLNSEVKITAQESGNLVNGKSVCRFLDGEERWIMIDRETNRLIEVPYNLEKNLSRLPIKEREDINKYQAAIDTLKKGGKKEITLLINEKPVKYLIEAAPWENTVYVFDKGNRLVDIDLIVNSQQTTKNLVHLINEEKITHSHKKGLHI